MDPDTPGTNNDVSALGPAKRKRSQRFNGSQSHPVGSVSISNDIMIGQVVSGFIEASFDGGYLLAVRAGNSETTMRGVVFKHGRFVPVSAENDVAPDVKMINRCEITQQGENLSNLQVSGGCSREKNGMAYHPLSFPSLTPVSSGGKLPPSREKNGAAYDPLSFPSLTPVSSGRKLLPSGEKNGAAYHPLSFSSRTPVSSGGKLPPSLSTQVMSPTLSRGNVVPVIQQPIPPVNGSMISNQPHPVAMQDARLSSVDRHAPTVPSLGSHALNGSAVTKASGNQETVNSDGAPFENLVMEVIKMIQQPTQADGNLKESSRLVGKSSSTLDDEVSDTDDQPLFVEPLQTLQPVLTSHRSLPPLQLDNDRTTKMTQLLQNPTPPSPGATR